MMLIIQQLAGFERLLVQRLLVSLGVIQNLFADNDAEPAATEIALEVVAV